MQLCLLIQVCRRSGAEQAYRQASLVHATVMIECVSSLLRDDMENIFFPLSSLSDLSLSGKTPLVGLFKSPRLLHAAGDKCSLSAKLLRGSVYFLITQTLCKERAHIGFRKISLNYCLDDFKIIFYSYTAEHILKAIDLSLLNGLVFFSEFLLSTQLPFLGVVMFS